MNAIHYSQRHLHQNPVPALALGLFMTSAAFLALPLLTEIPNPWASPDGREISEPEPFDPPAEVIETPDKKIEAEPIEEPVLDKPLPPIDLEMLSKLINATDGGARISVGIGSILDKVDNDAKVFLPDALDQQPRVLVPAKPIYPYSMRARPGKVTVEFIIDEKGRVRKARVVNSTNPNFNRPALESIRNTTWAAGEKAGRPVQARVRLAVVFNGGHAL